MILKQTDTKENGVLHEEVMKIKQETYRNFLLPCPSTIFFLFSCFSSFLFLFIFSIFFPFLLFPFPTFFSSLFNVLISIDLAV